MNAYKLRPDADYVDQTRGRRAPRRVVEAIGSSVSGVDHGEAVAHPSPARAMQAELATRLQPGFVGADGVAMLSARAQLAIIVGGSMLLWMPIVAVAWAIFG